MSGQTIEVLNTDAEGRLVLGGRTMVLPGSLQTQLMIDLATLTGAVIVALGHHCAGLFSNNDELASRLLEAGKAVGEEVWRCPSTRAMTAISTVMPPSQKYGGGRAAGSIIGAQFLQRFITMSLGASRYCRDGVVDQGYRDRTERSDRLWRTPPRPIDCPALREGRRRHPFGGESAFTPVVDAARTGLAQAPRAGLRPRPPDRRQGEVERARRVSVRGVWTYEEAAFLRTARYPRPCRRAADLADAPCGKNPNGASILVLVDGVEARISSPTRAALDLFDGNDADMVEAARGPGWRRARAAGHTLTYCSRRLRAGSRKSLSPRRAPAI